ncbi:DUF4271 domain-containing protein [Fulvivirga maritima]|uniref:DUF4271 domain-containing protein n=1 Tax=Fulvivirga maritima TaxID=2904247 RepID=UPI001F384FD7|nr:DUF4271 domain-containing protein [Fulvivirga maritima]UII28489.1 DUF4271 domain-containing protein [Fulvivirga maritima]
MKRLLILLFLAHYSIFSFSQDTTMIRDLDQDWYFYEDDGYLPLIDKGDYHGKTLHFNLNSNDYAEATLLLTSDQQLSIFINNKLSFVLKSKRLLSIDSLAGEYGENMHFTIYNKNLNPFQIGTHIIRIEDASTSPLADNLIMIKQRKRSTFNEVIIVGMLILIALLAILYSSYPKVFSDFFKVRRAMSMRELDENLLKTRPLSVVNLLFYFYLSMMVAVTLMLYVNLSGTFQEVGIFRSENFWEGLFNMLKVALLVFFWFLLKYLVIANLTSLFKLGFFQSSHFYNSVRINILIFSICVILITGSYFCFSILNPEYYTILFNILLIMMGLRVIILFFRLMNTGSYKTLHLFSYLCGTEVIPYVVLLYFGFNQPF